MPVPIDPATEMLIRVGIFGVDVNNKRWMISETWRFTRHVSLTLQVNVMNTVWGRWITPFGAGAGLPNYNGARMFMDRIFPNPRILARQHAYVPTVGPPLNPAAPEAAYRLQRVGAGGASTVKGRINPPILTDAFFLDLPHRRHIDVDYLQPLLTAWMDTRPQHLIFFDYTVTNVIFHRRTMEVTPVTNFIVKPNPSRLWQRWRDYPQDGHTPTEDHAWLAPMDVYS